MSDYTRLINASTVSNDGELFAGLYAELKKIAAGRMAQLGLMDEDGQPILTRKGDPRKVALAAMVKAHTNVDNEWISQRLKMGHNRSVSRLIRQGNDNSEIKKLCSKLLKMLPCED